MGSIVPEIASLLDAAVYNSLGFYFVALGILVSIRFTGFPDLTVDGSFTIGAAAYAVSLSHGFPVALGLLLAATAGMIGGLLTAGINQVLQIGKIISSVLTMLLLILVVPYISGASTIGLLIRANFLNWLQAVDLALTRRLYPESPFSLHFLFSLLFIIVAALITYAVRNLFLSGIGIQIRYIGSSVFPGLLKARRRGIMLYAGLAIGNCLIGFGGAIEAQRNGGFNQNMGIGTILVGLAILILGESVVKRRVRRDQLYVSEYLAAAALGVLVYSLGIQILLFLRLVPFDVRLMTTLFLLVMLSYSARRHPNTTRLF